MRQQIKAIENMKIGESVTQGLMSSHVQRSDGTTITIETLVNGSPSLLVFVRHFGCIGCSENVSLLSSRWSELSALGVRTFIIGVGPRMFIEPFRERQNLVDAPVDILTDPTLETHQAAGLMYGLWGGFRPKALLEMGRAFTNGHVSRKPEGDIRQHAGALFIDGHGTVCLYHRNQSLGDHVSGQAIVDVALRSWLDEHPEVV